MSGILQAVASGGGRPSAAQIFSANSTNQTVTVSSLSGYVAGKTDCRITINTGIYVYSTSTATPALTITGGQSGDTVTIINNGFIVGKGGFGASNGAISVATFGSAGGIAISLTAGGPSVTIDNTNASAYIGGGGGGGSLDGTGTTNKNGGGGGGAGGGNGGYRGDGLSAGGAGGILGNSGSNSAAGYLGGGSGGGGAANPTKGTSGGGGGGGTVFPGTGGSALGNGGAGGDSNNVGGNGGAIGAAGGGGGYGAAGGAGSSGAAGGAGGKAVALNGRSITWTSGDTTRVYGVVS